MGRGWRAIGALQPLPPLKPSAALRDVGTLPNRHLQSQSQFEFLLEKIQILLEKNWFFIWVCTLQIPGGSDGKESACNVGDLRWIPGLGRSLEGRHVNPLQCSCLENPHGQASLAGYSPWGCKERLTTLCKLYNTGLFPPACPPPLAAPAPASPPPTQHSPISAYKICS